MNEMYKSQVALVLDTLPEIAKEGNLALQINSLISETEKEFLLSFKKLAPDWDIYDFKEFPAVKWKMKNLSIFKEKNEAGYHMAVQKLEDFLT